MDQLGDFVLNFDNLVKLFTGSSTTNNLVKSLFEPFYEAGDGFPSPARRNESAWFHPHPRIGATHIS
jgi:hypothetical protein